MWKASLLPLSILQLLIGCVSPQATAPGEQALHDKTGLSEEDLIRTSPGEAVTLDVALLNPLKENERELVFKVYINIRSMDLPGFNIDQLATFRNSEGLEVKEESIWISERDSPHHRSGYP
jgi:hypothetical protein